SFRSKSIEGVPTSTTGFAGMTRFGPVQYPEGPTSTDPRLITSFTEFERVYGGLEPVNVLVNGSITEHTNFMAHAARAFFANGGKRLYVSRVFSPRAAEQTPQGKYGYAAQTVGVPGFPSVTWRARWPGEMGNIYIKVEA